MVLYPLFTINSTQIIIHKGSLLHKKAHYFLLPHTAGLLCPSRLNASQRFRHWSKRCRGSRWDRQWGKPASVRSTATGCQLPIRLPPCGVCRPCLERSVVTSDLSATLAMSVLSATLLVSSDRRAQTRGPRCCGIEEQKRGINILPLIPQAAPPPQGNHFTTNNHIP